MYNIRIRKQFTEKQIKEITARAEIGYRMLRGDDFRDLLTSLEIELDKLFDTLKTASDPYRTAQIQGQIHAYEMLLKKVQTSSP